MLKGTNIWNIFLVIKVSIHFFRMAVVGAWYSWSSRQLALPALALPASQLTVLGLLLLATRNWEFLAEQRSDLSRVSMVHTPRCAYRIRRIDRPANYSALSTMDLGARVLRGAGIGAKQGKAQRYKGKRVCLGQVISYKLRRFRHQFNCSPFVQPNWSIVFWTKAKFITNLCSAEVFANKRCNYYWWTIQAIVL